MKRLFSGITLLTLVVAAVSFSDESGKCAKYKNGAFRMIGRTNGLHYIITRKGNVQTEVTVETGNVFNLRIKWLSNCSFEMKHISSTGADAEKQKFYDNLIMTVQILGGTDKYYVCRTTNNMDFPATTDTMWIKR